MHCLLVLFGTSAEASFSAGCNSLKSGEGGRKGEKAKGREIVAFLLTSVAVV